MRRRFRRSGDDSIEEAITPLDESDGGLNRRGSTDTLTDSRIDDVVTDTSGADGGAAGTAGVSFDDLLARQLDRVEQIVDPVETVTHLVDEPQDDLGLADAPAEDRGPIGRTPEPQPDANVDANVDADPDVGTGQPMPGVARPSAEFWDHYDRAVAEAELAVVPPAAVVAVVGPLEASMPVIRRCRDRHWMGQCDVFVLTPQPSIPDEPDWNVVGQPSDLIAVLGEGGSDFPLIVLDVPCELPSFVQPLVAHLREQGVGLVHYVLDDDPADEDLATWHGELGQPSVLDLAGPVSPDRVLDLFDRGEPVASVADHDLTTELLLAFRIEQTADDRA